jgi:hypothetical protein
MNLDFNNEQWRMAEGLLDDPSMIPLLHTRITQYGPAVTALLINKGVIR